MMWKKEGNHLEWIVRQMSWMPPWVKDEAEDKYMFKAAANKKKGSSKDSSNLNKKALDSDGTHQEKEDSWM